MDWVPNIEGVSWFLKEVWPLVSEKIPYAQLTLAGKNMPPEFYRNNQGNVSVQGFVQDAGKFLFDAGIVIVPLLNGSGLRIKLLEGLAMGKAIVTTPVGCEGIPVIHGENVLIARTATDFAEALIDLLQNPEKQAALRESARALVSKAFNSTVIGLETMRFVQKLKENPSSAQS
jgi:glycosyltransferase involved in cell wall biosynthesis